MTGGPAAPGRRLVPMLDLRAQHRSIRAEVDDAIARVLDSGRFILGPEVEALERQVAERCGCRYAVGMSSGTDALLASLLVEGIGPGDEVIVPDYSFVATAEVVVRTGATPVFLDVDPATHALDVRAFAAAIGPRTRAVVPVHIFGQPAEMVPIVEVARARGVLVVEDAAQAIAATDGGRPVGSFGDLAALSFFPSKNLGAIGDGGMVVTNDVARAERLRRVRVHGAARKHEYVVIGGNFRLDEIQAAVLAVKLAHLDAWTAARRRNATRYRALLGDVAASGRLVLPTERAGVTHVYNQFVVRSPMRDALRARLADEGVTTESYYPTPLHAQPCFAHLPTCRASCPIAEHLAQTSLSLPVHPELADADLEHVARTVAAFAAQRTGSHRPLAQSGASDDS